MVKANEKISRSFVTMIQTTATTGDYTTMICMGRVYRPADTSIGRLANECRSYEDCTGNWARRCARVPFSRQDASAGAITITAIVLTSTTTLRDDDGRRRYDRDNKEIRELIRPDDNPFVSLERCPWTISYGGQCGHVFC